jgi:hypothetical protein
LRNLLWLSVHPPKQSRRLRRWQQLGHGYLQQKRAGSRGSLWVTENRF